MLFLEIVFLLLLLVLLTVAPGFVFVRKFRWTPLEKWCGSIGVSLALIYLGAWAVFCFGPRNPRIGFAGVALVLIALAFVARKDIWRILRTHRVREAVRGYGFLLAWTLLMLTIIR